MILNILDSTILNVAAPSIQRDLSLSASALEWIAAAYTLAIAVGLLAGGRLGDAFGRKRMLMTGLVGFVASSVLCSVAWSSESLIAGRVLQGLAAAVMIPQTFGLIRDIFGPADIGKAFAAFGPAIGLSTVLGPVVAGALIELDPFGTDWRSLFLINVPVGLFAIVVGRRVLPANEPAHRGARLDWVGIALTAVVSFLVVFPLVEGRTLGWPVWLVGVVAAAAPLLYVVGRRQRGRIARGETPLVELSVLRKRSYVSGVVFTMVFFGSIVGFSLTTGLFLQIGLGLTPMKAALYLAGFAVGAFFGSGVGAWATTAVGRPILHVGLAIMAVGTAVLYALAARRERHRLGPAGPGHGRLRARHGDDLRPAVQHHHGRDRGPRGRLGLGPARVVPAARRLARGGRAGDAVLRHHPARGRRSRRRGDRRPARRWPPSTPCSSRWCWSRVAFAIGFLLPKKAREMGH